MRILGLLLLGMLVYGQMPAAAPSEPPAPPEMVTYYIGFLKRGPKWTPEVTDETKKIQAGHMAHMRKSHAAKALVVAGPIGDDGELRGILIYKTANLEEARRWANEDPAVLAGRLVLEIHPWLVQKGTLP